MITGPRPGEWIRTTVPLDGVMQGPSKLHGDGAAGEIPSGSLREVFDVEPVTGLLTIHFDLEDSGAHEPFLVEAQAFRSEVVPAQRPQLPPIVP